MTQTWLAQTALRHATLARDYLRCFSTLAATPSASDEATGMMARLAVQQAIWAQSAACGRRCPNYCRIQDAAKYAGIRTLMPESVLDQYDASAPWTSIREPIRSMPGYDNIVQTDVAILVRRALREIGEDLEAPEGNAPVGMRT